jgi:hypothetical protein
LYLPTENADKAVAKVVKPCAALKGPPMEILEDYTWMVATQLLDVFSV